jgi:hypothetical protein
MPTCLSTDQKVDKRRRGRLGVEMRPLVGGFVAGCGVWIAALAGCSAAPGGARPDGASEPAALPSAPLAAEPAPFAPQPDLSEGLVNTSADLGALLEHGALAGACAASRAAHDDRRLLLLCGKSMFFYEGFGTIGIPEALVDAIPAHFEDQVGPAFSAYGLIPDPTSPQGRALGFAPGAPLEGVPTLALTCAACHLGVLPDGRYAVGAPNHDYRYGDHMLSILLAPAAASPTFDPADHHPDAIRAVQGILDALEGDLWLQVQLGIDLLPLLGILNATAPMSVETEGHYAHWLSGTMDFLIAPLPVDDGVHTVSKTSALWGFPTADEQGASGMPHAMLAWTGSGHSLDDFLAGFVTIGGGDPAWQDPAALAPLREYLLSLTPPAPPAGDPAAIVRGEAVFAEAGCLDCHAGPRGGGDRVYPFDEIGTDDALARWGDPALSGVLCCGMDDGVTAPTHGVKSPRLVGLWAMGRFLHNGSVRTLDELLCLAPRSENPVDAFGSQGHGFGCALGEGERRDLVAFLNAH